jgi:hypothetical protein
VKSNPTGERADVTDRIDGVDWQQLERDLDRGGNAVVRRLLTESECELVASLYDQAALFRSRVVMARHGYGRGEYQYFAYPLPDLVGTLRRALYPRLIPTANRWNAALRIDVHFPDEHEAFVERCHASGQTRPTPLLLTYSEGDYNCLHQDVYGEHVFPLQVAVLLSDPETEFDGGEFVMTEQRPRMQSRPMVIPLARGDAVVFAVRHRPVVGARGIYRVNLRHGVSQLRSGQRRTLGIIFHDAT